jgi:hypothetical protein
VHNRYCLVGLVCFGLFWFELPYCINMCVVSIFLSFFLFQRIAYVKEIEAEDDANVTADDGMGGGGNARAAPAAAAPSRAGTAAGATRTGSAAPPAEGAEGGEGVDDARKLEYEARKKEEDEFAKLEAAFIAELELKTTELPDYAKHLGVDAPEKGKDGKK